MRYHSYNITETASASLGSFGVSATRYRGTEDVRVTAIIIAPFEFRDVQRQISTADFVKAAHDPAFQKRPEAIDCLRVDSAVDILTSAMPNGAMLFQLTISRIFVSRDQAYFFGNGFSDKVVQGFGIGMCDDTGHDIALALDGAHNGILAFAACSWRTLIPVTISVL